MKKLLIIALFCIYSINCIAQKRPPVLPAVGYGDNYIYSISPPGSNIGLDMTIDKYTQWVQYNNNVANQPLTNYVLLGGAKKIKLYMVALVKDMNDYRYNIIANDSTLLVTNAIPKHAFRYVANGRSQIDLGEFNIDDKKLTVEIYKLSERSKVSTVTIYNKEIKPAEIIQTTLKRYFIKSRGEGVEMQDYKNDFKFQINDGKNNNVTGVIVVTKPTDLTFIYHVYLKNLATGKTVHVSNDWIYGYFVGSAYIDIDASYFSTPGKYQVIIIPGKSSGDWAFLTKYFPEKTRRINFTVLESGRVYQEKIVVRAGVLILLAILLIPGLLFYFIKKRNRRKLLAAQQQKDMAQVQLSAVRSQLNPHFMFNALSGIQNLMNKNEVDQANRYLAKFARITRSILNNKELTSLADEKNLLDDYLQMEQLRFGFLYKIEIDEHISPENVEIPAMLLQPFAENAVKHGVADMGKNGYIYIKMMANGKDLILTITDNGKGFDPAKQNDGLGIALVKKRVTLLNTVYQSSPVWLDITSAPSNTVITFTLTQWL
ncbi:Histidine kinase-, DNA gyrase B-, and HSP90-like ATPase [Mucilaginibacter pineti]|uniref:Histidine kinase-, DNA gyrase B-, and HSP90-like ATPase n=1 Tax=Mucilaginibacter pineti TaxID=1391627 RepID=A0A1G6W304_9SPHI|nr:histidine kinase [Mucilaginibacter pineti]SDD59425.1 Histidine kinase-, DNA gyrase B-, and HSP90-like ATPase [Mucilaginibacter pineti]